jgi:predicted phage tail protein
MNNIKKVNFSKSVMKNRDTFSRFIYKLHNNVNKMLKKNIKISYEDVRYRYEHFRSRCNESMKKEIIKKKQTNKEKGCTESMYNTKSKCIINIVPKTSRRKGFTIDSKCKIKK